MPIDATHNAAVGFALFDMWLRAVEKSHHTHHGRHADNIASPLIDAAFQAFNAYAQSVEAGNQAQIAAVSSQLLYAPNPSTPGTATTQQLAPFYALNLLA